MSHSSGADQRSLSDEEILYAVVRQAIVLKSSLTAHDVLEQVKALGRGDIIVTVREDLRAVNRS